MLNAVWLRCSCGAKWLTVRQNSEQKVLLPPLATVASVLSQAFLVEVYNRRSSDCFLSRFFQLTTSTRRGLRRSITRTLPRSEKGMLAAPEGTTPQAGTRQFSNAARKGTPTCQASNRAVIFASSPEFRQRSLQNITNCLGAAANRPRCILSAVARFQSMRLFNDGEL